MTSSLLFLALTPLTNLWGGFGRYRKFAGLETASLELNAHLRVQPAHCVYDFYDGPITYNAVVRYAITLQ